MGMHEVMINKTKALEKLRANRAKHQEEYLLALKGHKEILKEYFQEELGSLAVLPEGESWETSYPPPAPHNHLEAYDRHIQMLEWEVDLEVTLTAAEFNNLILDKWDWKEAWGHTMVANTIG
jgi:hypothetical protein